MRFRSHDTFSIRKGWLHKGMRHVNKNPRIFVDKNINQMDELGIGANMVKALRYWLQAVGLTNEGSGSTREQYFTEFGELVWNNDCYIEEDGTLYLLHYFLVSNKEMATSWYYFFNEFNVADYEKITFVENISNYISLNSDGKSIARNSLEDDFDCLIKTYIPTSASSSRKDTPENNIDSPLSELRLLTVADRKTKTYTRTITRSGTIHPLIILSVILNEKEKNKDLDEIKISRLEKEHCNIGRVFNLDSHLISSYLDKLEYLGYLKVIRTAGLDLIKIITTMKFADCLFEYYNTIDS